MLAHKDPPPTLVHACRGASISVTHPVGLSAPTIPQDLCIENLIPMYSPIISKLVPPLYDLAVGKPA